MFQFSLSMTLNAPIDQVYQAFHNPERLMQWFAPGVTLVAQMMSDFTEGGRYRIILQEPNGAQNSLTGQFTRIIPNEYLAYSWAWEDNLEESVITQVELVFTPRDDSTTEVTLTHSGFANEQEREQHQYGWISCLEKLAALNLS